MNDTAIVGENVEIIQTKGPQSAFNWSVVIAGALAAWAVAFIFISLGSGIGLSVASPYSGPSAGTLGIAGAIWMIFAQTLAFTTGGYIAARLRIRDHIPGPETKFRDGAHGFMAWVVGASFMAIALFVASAFSARTAADFAGAATNGGGAAPVHYYVDRLFRTDPRIDTASRVLTPAATSTAAPFVAAAPASGNAASGAENAAPAAPAPSGTGNAGNETNGPAPASASASPQTDRQDSGGLVLGPREEAQRYEAIRIMAVGMGDSMSDTDHQYLAQLVAAQTGMTQAEADRRVTEVRNEAKEKLKKAAETARKAGAYLSFWSFMALLFGAVAATLAGILGGELRDEYWADR